MKIYLASKSLRRKELLTQMGVAFELLLVDIPEEVAPGETIAHYSRRITHEKLKASWDKVIKEKLPLLPVLCADTEVVLDETILGKPFDYNNAFSMLKNLSNRHHQVITSVGICYDDYEKIMMQETIVHFAAIPDEEIHHYLASGDYKDKAGGYGIQSYIGQFIHKIEGCYYSVMGLPLNMVRELILDLKRHVGDKKNV